MKISLKDNNFIKRECLLFHAHAFREAYSGIISISQKLDKPLIIYNIYNIIPNRHTAKNIYMKAINLAEKFAKFSDHWNPRIVGELNGQHAKLAKLKGEFVWHSHEHEDELFLVIKGSLTMVFRDKTVQIEEGEFIIVPKGVEHKPVAEEEVSVMLFEPASTINTGNADSDLRRNHLENI